MLYAFSYVCKTHFAGIMIIYSPAIFHSWPASAINARGKDEGIKSTEGPYNEKLRALNNYNAQIKQSYYYYN